MLCRAAAGLATLPVDAINYKQNGRAELKAPTAPDLFICGTFFKFTTVDNAHLAELLLLSRGQLQGQLVMRLYWLDCSNPLSKQLLPLTDFQFAQIYNAAGKTHALLRLPFPFAQLTPTASAHLIAA